MPESDSLISLAFDAYSKLEHLAQGVDQVNDHLSALLVDPPNDGISDLPALLLELHADEEPVTVVEAAPAVPDAFYNHLLAFEWMQTATGVFILVALLLSLGVQLWLAFSDKWRS